MNPYLSRIEEQLARIEEKIGSGGGGITDDTPVDTPVDDTITGGDLTDEEIDEFFQPDDPSPTTPEPQNEDDGN